MTDMTSVVMTSRAFIDVRPLARSPVAAGEGALSPYGPPAPTILIRALGAGHGRCGRLGGGVRDGEHVSAAAVSGAPLLPL
jgi:hypothetical protein